MSIETFDVNVIAQTATEEIATAMVFLQGKLIVGLGHVLRVYELGKKKMLRKCESKVQNRLFLLHASCVVRPFRTLRWTSRRLASD